MRWLCLFLCFGLCAEELDLRRYEVGVYSPGGEDGVLACLFDALELQDRICVELGAGDGVVGSLTLLLRMQGWRSFLFDREVELLPFEIQKEFITAHNINRVFAREGVPREFGLLVIRLHYNDFYVWRAMHPMYRPEVVVIEYNAIWPVGEDRVVKHFPFYVGDGTGYFGASMAAMAELGKQKRYTLVYADAGRRFLFFVRDDVLRASGVQIRGMGDVAVLDEGGVRSVPFDPRHRPWVSSSEVLP